VMQTGLVAGLRGKPLLQEIRRQTDVLAPARPRT
jgi:hypothetical protein